MSDSNVIPMDMRAECRDLRLEVNRLKSERAALLAEIRIERTKVKALQAHIREDPAMAILRALKPKIDAALKAERPLPTDFKIPE